MEETAHLENIFSRAIQKTKNPHSQALDLDAVKQPDTQPFVFIFNRKASGARAHFLCLHPHKGYLLPHIQHITWPKLKGWNDYCTVVYKHELYFLGGIDRETGRYSSKVQKYNPQSDKWTALSSMKMPRSYFTATVVEKRIVVIGGETIDGDVTDSIESYEPHIDLWSQEGKLPEPRRHHTTCLISNKLYICGGQSKTNLYNNNIWELTREFRLAGERANFHHEWDETWDQLFTRKVQQMSSLAVNDKLFCVGGLVQGATDDGKILIDELDINEPNSELDDDESGEKQVRHQLAVEDEFVPSYRKYLQAGKKKKTQTIIKTTRRMFSVDVTNDYLKTKNPYKALAIEKRMRQPRAGAALLKLGNRLYVFGGYNLEDENTYIPTVEYYHVIKHKWYPAFDLTSSDGESFRDVEIQLLHLPKHNQNFKLNTSTYKYPMW